MGEHLRMGKSLYIIDSNYLYPEKIPTNIRAKYLINNPIIVNNIVPVKVIGITKYIDGTYGYVIGKKKQEKCIFPMDYGPKWHINHHEIDENFKSTFVFTTKEKAIKHYKATYKEDEVKRNRILRKYLKED